MLRKYFKGVKNYDDFREGIDLIKDDVENTTYITLGSIIMYVIKLITDFLLIVLLVIFFGYTASFVIFAIYLLRRLWKSNRHYKDCSNYYTKKMRIRLAYGIEIFFYFIIPLGITFKFLIYNIWIR